MVHNIIIKKKTQQPHSNAPQSQMGYDISPCVPVKHLALHYIKLTLINDIGSH